MSNWITNMFSGKSNDKKASIPEEGMPEERQIDSDNWAEGLSEDADALDKMSAATAGTIFQQFVDDLGDEKRTAFHLSHLEHALSYAPGMDMIDTDHWTQLMDIAKNQDVFRFKEIVQDFAEQYADQKGTSYEKHMKDTYPVDDKEASKDEEITELKRLQDKMKADGKEDTAEYGDLLKNIQELTTKRLSEASKKKAAYEKGDDCKTTIEKDYKLRVGGLSDRNLAEMIAERILAEKGLATLDGNEEIEKQMKSVKSGRESAEKKLLSLIGDHTKLDWQKAFKKFEDAKPIIAKDEALEGDEVAKSKWNKKETFTEKSDKEKTKDMEGVGKEEEKGQVGKEASKKKADEVPVDPEAPAAEPQTKLMAVYSVYKSVTDYNEDSQDWSGEFRDMGGVAKENMEVNSIEEVLAKAQNDLGLVHPFEPVPDEAGEYDTNQVEDRNGYQDEDGKFLADYRLSVKMYKEASIKKKAIEVPKDFAVQPLKPGEPAKDAVTCGVCGLTWDDGVSTGWTPTPSGRCPFEYFHEDIDASKKKADDDEEETEEEVPFEHHDLCPGKGRCKCRNKPIKEDDVISPYGSVKKKASDITDTIRKKVEKKVKDIVEEVLADTPPMVDPLGAPPVDGMPTMDVPVVNAPTVDDAVTTEELPVVEIKKQDDETEEENKEEEGDIVGKNILAGKCKECGEPKSNDKVLCSKCFDKKMKEKNKDASKKKADRIDDVRDKAFPVDSDEVYTDEPSGEDSAEELAESFVNGNISYVKEKLQNNVSLFINVEMALEQMNPDSIESFRRIMTASKKTAVSDGIMVEMSFGTVEFMDGTHIRIKPTGMHDFTGALHIAQVREEMIEELREAGYVTDDNFFNYTLTDKDISRTEPNTMASKKKADTKTCKWCKKNKLVDKYNICNECHDSQQKTLNDWNTSDRDIELGDPETASNYYASKKAKLKKKADVLTDTVTNIKDKVNTTKERLEVQTKESDIGDGTYEGWKNHATWAIALWINNDQGMYEEVTQMVSGMQDIGEAAEAIKNYIDGMKPDLGSTMWADIFEGAVSDIDWLEIAQDMKGESMEQETPAVEEPAVTPPDVPSGTPPTASRKKTKEITSKVSRKDIIAKFKRKADIDSPWKVVLDENGDEVIAMVAPLKREKLSKDKKLHDKKSN